MKLFLSLGIQGRLLLSHLAVVMITAAVIYTTSSAMTPWVMKQSALIAGSDITAVCADATKRSLIWGLGAAALVAGLMSTFVSRRLVAPLKKMQALSSSLASGNYKQSLNEELPGELGLLAKAFNQMSQQLAAVEKQRVMLISDLSHELSTPLTSLKGFLEGIEDGFFEANQKTLSACQRQVKRLEHLIQDLSLVSKVEAGAYELHKSHINIHALLERCRQDALPSANSQDISIVLEGDPLLHTYVDAKRIEQVVTNLLNNAIKHSQDGNSVTMAAKQNNKTIAISVQDRGAGIPQNAIKNIFTRFYQADTSRKAPGSGIGLTIAKHLVEAHDGRLMVESTPGKGSCFTIELPMNTPGHFESSLSVTRRLRPALN